MAIDRFPEIMVLFFVLLFALPVVLYLVRRRSGPRFDDRRKTDFDARKVPTSMAGGWIHRETDSPENDRIEKEKRRA